MSKNIQAKTHSELSKWAVVYMLLSIAFAYFNIIRLELLFQAVKS